MCGSYRVTRLKTPDRIDRFHTGFLNFLERIAGKGKLVHCRWCRIQFYDRRPLATEIPKSPDEVEEPKTVERVEAAETVTEKTANPANPA
jgi:hypothetical protein